MKFYKFKPDESSVFFSNPRLNQKTFQPELGRFYSFPLYWHGDEVFTAHDTVIVSKEIKISIEDHEFTGYKFDLVECSAPDLFQEFYPEIKFPEYFSLNVIGKPFEDDLGILWKRKKREIIISEKVVLLLKKFNINNAIMCLKDR